MVYISSNLIKSNLLQAISDELPQLLIWHNFTAEHFHFNRVAEEVVQDAMTKKNLQVALFESQKSVNDNLISILNLKDKNYLKCQILITDPYSKPLYRIILLQHLRQHEPNEIQKHMKALYQFQETALKPLFEMIGRWEKKSLCEQYRIALLASEIAKDLDLSPATQNNIFIAAMLMDIGTMLLDNEITDLPRQYNEIEFSLIKTHAESSHAILCNIPFEAPIAQYVLQHHERYDGSGYPHGLRKDEIWLEARILGVANTIIAMLSERPHRQAYTLEQTLANIKKLAGIKFDPIIADASVKLMQKREIQELISLHSYRTQDHKEQD